MKTLKFDNTSFILYQILPNHKKIDFLNQSFTGNISNISKAFYKQHFRNTLKHNAIIEVGILSYQTDTGAKVNIFLQDDYMHVNSDKLIPIRELIHATLYDGDILILDKTKKKTKENRDRYHLKYYRAYRRINPIDKFLPIILS